MDEVSLPEPGLAVTCPTGPTEHPSTAHAVIEVAVTSQRLDLAHKAPRYAAAGVPLYVVIDLADRQAVVHRDPGLEGYSRVERLGGADPLEVLGMPIDLGLLLAADV